MEATALLCPEKDRKGARKRSLSFAVRACARLLATQVTDKASQVLLPPGLSFKRTRHRPSCMRHRDESSLSAAHAGPRSLVRLRAIFFSWRRILRSNRARRRSGSASSTLYFSF